MTIRELRDRLSEIIDRVPNLADHEITALDKNQKFSSIQDVALQCGDTAVWLNTEPENTL